MSNGLVKIKNRDNFSNVIAVRDVHVLDYIDENGNRATIFCDSLQDAQMIKEDIMRHHPTASSYTINRFAIFKGVK